MIALLDVHCTEPRARAACIVAADWDAPRPLETRVRLVGDVAAYEPGAFWKRELPCLLAVLGEVRAAPLDAAVDAARRMAGAHRMPPLATAVDPLARGRAVAGA